MEDQHDHERHEVTDEADHECCEHADKLVRVCFELKVIDASKYVCGAENDQDGQKRTNLAVKHTLFKWTAGNDLVALLAQSVDEEEDGEKEGEGHGKETPAYILHPCVA